MKLSDSATAKVAELAQIEIATDEQHKLAEDLSKVIGYVDQLGTVDTQNVADVGQITGMANAMQEDVAKECEIDREEFLVRAPLREGDYIKVKKIL